MGAAVGFKLKDFDVGVEENGICVMDLLLAGEDEELRWAVVSLQEWWQGEFRELGVLGRGRGMYRLRLAFEPDIEEEYLWDAVRACGIWNKLVELGLWREGTETETVVVEPQQEERVLGARGLMM